MILPIYAYGHPVLRKECVEIDKDYPKLDEIIANMRDTMANAEGIGLAAPQVGINIRLFLVDASRVDDVKTKGFKETFINPVMIDEYDKEWPFEEGCLSIPEVRENVTRNAKIKIRYQDENFKQHEKEFDGMIARIIQHEYDHIEGVLFTDLILPLRKRLIKNKLKSISGGKVGAHYRMKYPVKSRKR
jgi:peptide deformylase